MRIISGLYRGRVIKSPTDHKTRPTSDRLRETLFNILAPKIHDETRFLDLCAGTGAVGIEALSREVCFSTFVDKSKRSCALIEANLDLLGVPEEKTEVICLAAENFTSRRHGKAWDIIFFDPPYQADYLMTIRDLDDAELNLLTEEGIFIAEHHAKSFLPDAIGTLRRWRLVKQGETRLSFYEKS